MVAPRTLVITLALLLSTAPAMLPFASAKKPSCSISGFVVDDEFLPIDGAAVGLFGEAIQTTTDHSGSFEFARIDPGPYTVVATRLGYDPASHHVDCVDGEHVEVTLMLVAIDPPARPYLEIRFFGGIIECAIGAGPIGTTDLCGASSHVEIKTPAEDLVTGAVFEANWTRTSAVGGECLGLAVPLPRSGSNASLETDDTPTVYGVRGESPLGATFITDPASHLFIVGDDLAVVLRAVGTEKLVGAIECQSLVVYQQPYVVAASLFMNGLEVPDGYTALV